MVAETGMRGGGIEPGLLLGSVFSAVPAGVPLLEAPLFHDRLSLRRSELMDDGVGGSSGSDMGGGDFVLVLIGFCALGPEGFC